VDSSMRSRMDGPRYLHNGRKSATVPGRILVLHPTDNVGVALTPLGCGEAVVLGVEPTRLAVREDVPALHKVALVAIDRGGEVRKHGHVIGRATREVLPGMHVHTHNLVDDYGGVY
jgi:altronate hydrolase